MKNPYERQTTEQNDEQEKGKFWCDRQACILKLILQQCYDSFEFGSKVSIIDVFLNSAANLHHVLY